jgi:hypothetical protein
MKKYRVEMTLLLQDDVTPEDWVFNSVADLLEHDQGEKLLLARHIDLGYVDCESEVN